MPKYKPHISLNAYLGFGRFRYMTGRQLLKHQDGHRYLQWAHTAGINISHEILFEIGLHPEQINPVKGPIPITPELLAEAKAHEDQLNGAPTHENTQPSNTNRISNCPYCNDASSTQGGGDDVWLLFC